MHALPSWSRTGLHTFRIADFGFCSNVFTMAEVVYVSNIHLERRKGPLRLAYLPGEKEPVVFSVHGGIAKHYGVDESKLGESHAATLDYIVAATGG